MAALRIIGSGEFPRSQLFGSWAGAMGQTQFIPTSFLSTAAFLTITTVTSATFQRVYPFNIDDFPLSFNENFTSIISTKTF